MSLKIAFIGAGRMAAAMVRGLLANPSQLPADIVCTAAPDGTAEALSKATGIGVSYDWQRLFSHADWVVLACKPQQLTDLPPELADWTAGRRILSILAGTSLQTLSTRFPKASAVVRTMPNTPGMIQAGMTVFAPLKPLSDEDHAATLAILGSLGKVIEVDEKDINGVTGVSGSGPAYVFEFVAALRDGGIAAGLDPTLSYELALETVKGAAALLEAVPETPETHRNWVSSPGGTTLAGLAVMEDHDFRKIIRDTVLAARRRAEELS
jgi:pyrroline-5-carboxylate reductase